MGISEISRKRQIDYNIQLSKESEGVISIRNFVKNFTEPQEQKIKEIISFLKEHIKQLKKFIIGKKLIRGKN